MRFVALLATVACATTTPARPPEVPVQPVQQHPVAPDAPIEPWAFRWDAAVERERLPTDAAGLEAEYARVCGASSPPKLSGSPLLRYRESSYNTSSGVVVVLSPLAGTRDTLLAELRCHQVGLLLSPLGVDGSPFDVPGLAIDAVGDRYAIALTLTVRDLTDLADLQRRVERQVDETQRPHHED